MADQPKHGQVQVWSVIENGWVWRDLPHSEADDLREATRDAHAAMKDLRDLMRDFEHVHAEKKAEMENLVAQAMDKEISVIVKEGLSAYQETMSTAMEEAKQSVFARFDAIYDLLMGKTPAQRRRYGVDIEEGVGLQTAGDPQAVAKLIAERLKIDPVEGVTS